MTQLIPSPSYPGFRIGEDGSVIGPSGKTLALMADRRGYLRVSIYLGPKRWKRVGVHRLVCEAFHGPKPEWADLVAHADGNPQNNRANNLRWATFNGNEDDKRRHDRALLGERHHQAKLSEVDVRAMRAEREAGATLQSLASKYGVSVANTHFIVSRKTWRHI